MAFFALLAAEIYWKNIPIFLVIALFFAATVLPGLFKDRVQNLFSSRAVLEFTADGINITEYHLRKDILLNSYSINWCDVSAYKYYDAGRSDIVNLKFYFRNGESKLLKFREDVDIDDAIADENSLWGILHTCIKNYNNSANDKIGLKRFFINTRAGDLFIWSVAVICALAFCIHLRFHEKAPFIWLALGALDTFIFISLKKKYRLIYDKMIALN